MELNSDEIQKILPHRYPFLMIDRVIDCEPGSFAVARKCVSANEAHFQGHFPGLAVMPGVLILEALAQTGAVALLTEEENAGKVAFFAGAKNVRFKRKVIPGDVLELRCELTRRKGAIGSGKAVAMVGEEVAVEAEVTFALG